MRAAVYWFIAGSIIFLVWADYEKQVWNNAYFSWDAIRDLLFIVAGYNLIPKEKRWFLKPVIVYCLIRVLWELADLIQKGQLSKHGTVTEKVSSIGFLVLSVGVALLLLKDLKDRWEQNS